MRKGIILFFVLLVITIPISAMEITPPDAPDSVMDIMPEEPETFVEGLWMLVKAVIVKIQPGLGEAAGVCLSVIGAGLMISLLQPMADRGKKLTELAGTLSVAMILLRPTQSFINLGIHTITEMLSYGKLLLPVMTTGLAAQGGVGKSAALYSGTAVFNTVLGSLLGRLLVPVVYIYLALAVSNSAIGDQTLKKIRDLIKWCGTWVLKLGLYIFTGFLSLTGVITGSADAAALKLTKTTISTVVPVIGNILSEASETVLISAGLIKNAAGIYGMLAILALCLEPFFRIGIQYLLLKVTAATVSIFASKQTTELISDFSTALGMLLAATGTICLMLLISTVCFMKGVS